MLNIGDKVEVAIIPANHTEYVHTQWDKLTALYNGCIGTVQDILNSSTKGKIYLVMFFYSTPEVLQAQLNGGWFSESDLIVIEQVAPAIEIVLE